MKFTTPSPKVIWKILLLILLCIARGAAAQVLSTISIPITSCSSVAVNSNTNRIFTSGGASPGQVITMIDGNTNKVIRTLGTGSAARVDPLTNRIYAGAVFSPFRGFLVYDGATGNLITRITAFDCPIAAAVDSASQRIWGAAQCGSHNDAVFIVDGNTERLMDPPGRIGSGGVMGSPVVNPVTHIAYIFPSGVSKKVDPQSFAVSGNPFSGRVIAANPVENRLYAFDPQSNLIQVIDGASEATLTSFRGAGEAVVNPKQNRVYVADRLSHSVLVLDGATNKQLGNIPIPGVSPFGEIAVNITTGKLYLAMADATRATVLVIKDNVAGATKPQLLVSLSGTGTGTVTSNPAGINCGPAAKQCTATFPGGSPITLTPAPAARSAFGGWTGCDSVLGGTCTVTLSNVTKTVTATFRRP
jgi:YVTN family beta-propeller protein